MELNYELDHGVIPINDHINDFNTDGFEPSLYASHTFKATVNNFVFIS
jgi:hypothetical protein